ncbi:sulfotransferase family protein [Streptomyces sp. URMC 124]|uniref:sulfotransferase family protein n=1 Tax=Streptomyces sp. URMC 124 TaxID=3423405 RepID=UPI003F1D11FB
MNASGRIRTLPGDFSPPGGRPVDLVLRTVGERTTDLALRLAVENIRPNRVHIAENIRPLSAAVDRILAIDHRGASHVVHLDADCLVLEDMRPFLDANELAYTDCVVHDRFRGRVHCGVHITRADLVEGMRRADPGAFARDWLGPVLRPEAFRRHLARRELQPGVQLKGFRILHDHLQDHADVYAKYALRELRSRDEGSRARLEAAMAQWGDGPDFAVARVAVRHSRERVPQDVTPAQLAAHIEVLPAVAVRETAALGLPPLPPPAMADVHEAAAALPREERAKVFGLGLPGTGTRSLTTALHELGYDLASFPFGAGDAAALRRGDGRFPALRHYDGLADVFALPHLAELDALHPGARFVLTVRDKEGWLRAAERLWDTGWPAGAPAAERAAQREARRLFQERVCGGHGFDRERLARVYDAGTARVRAYFAGRPGELLVLDVCGGEGWEKLAPFLGRRAPAAPFPHTRTNPLDLLPR